MSAKPAWWKTLLRALLFLGVSMVTLVALALTWFSFSGRRELARVKAELRARGEKLSLTELLPPPVPPAENFFADPMWEELTDLVEVEMPGNPGVKMKEPRLSRGQRQLDGLFQSLSETEAQALQKRFPEFAAMKTEAVFDKLGRSPDKRAAEYVLAATAPEAPVLARLTQLAERSGGYFPLGYEMLGGAGERSSYFTTACRRLEMRARAHLVLGDTESARREALAILQMTEILSREPLLISLLVHLATGVFAVQAIDDGLKNHLWTSRDLEAFEKALAPISPLAATSMALRGERGNFNQMIENIEGERHDPFPGWYRWTFEAGLLALSNRMLQDWIDSIDSSLKTGFSPTRTISMKPVESLQKNAWNRIRYGAVPFPNITNIAGQAALLQNRVDQTRTACALERYRLAHGAYPEKLVALVPEFLPAIPTDVIDRRPLRYRREAPDRFVLWSAGENEIDDQGTGRDWVWGIED